MALSYSRRSEVGSQNSPSSPRPAKISFISSGFGRREFLSSRVEYQVVARFHNWLIFTSGRIGLSCVVHHSLTCSSDRKKSMLSHVKTISPHHREAGTRQ